MLGKPRITFFCYNFMFLYLNFNHFLIFSAEVGNPELGTQFIPNSDRLPEKIEHIGSTQHHPK
jgi:hypothetical protein